MGTPLDRCVISTAEHIAPFNYASTVSFVLPQLLIDPEQEDVPTEAVWVLGCGNIPLDNSDWPRGLLLTDDDGRTVRLGLWPRRLRKAVPLLLPARTLDASELASLAQHEYLIAAFQGSSREGSYARQLARVMEAMAAHWPAVHGSPPVRVAPGEEVAAAVLSSLLRGGDPLVRRLIEDATARSRLRESLHGVTCAWGDGYGSFLFWGAAPDNSGQVVPLREQAGYLVGDGVKVPFERDATCTGLETKRLLPGVALSLFAISWLPGIPIAGGPRQSRYWERMIEAFNAIFPDVAERPNWLSQFGYGPQMWDEHCASFGLPKSGTGLSLARRCIDPCTGRRMLIQGAGKTFLDAHHA
jgi:hypothetical protein